MPLTGSCTARFCGGRQLGRRVTQYYSKGKALVLSDVRLKARPKRLTIVHQRLFLKQLPKVWHNVLRLYA